MTNVQFSQIAVGKAFQSNGIAFIKKSTRTARLRYGSADERKVVHYFRNDETCNVVETRTVVNLMTGKEVLEDVNTPRCCSVASEAYWCM